MAIGPVSRDKPYVSPTGLTGWAAMASTVRDIDEEKVRYCKEDIDTLLVFAGLFSAVLTAFLIESYHSLQPPDPSTMAGSETASLLREIAMNTRVLSSGSGFSGTTSATALSADVVAAAAVAYSPPLSAVRVNMLWFASLVFSLATASFGMSVKQWLREYLACDYTSPQARLRIRQHRDPGLRAWKVLQLAAMLPLLLQLSLALFFVGLCFFTWSIEQTVARTTIVLVCAWAFFLCASFILPIFFPACPYKTTAFLRITRLLRARYFHFRAFLSAVLLATRGADVSTLLGDPAGGQRPWPRRFAQHCGEIIRPGQYLEEHEIAQNGNNDMNMLISVDAALTDDNILATTIWEAVRQLRLSPRDTLTFLSQVVEHRIQLQPLQLISTPTEELFDLRALTLRGWEAVTAIASSIILRGFESSTMLAWSAEMKAAFCVILSYSSYPLPDHHVQLLKNCLEDHSWFSCSQLLHSLSLRDSEASTQILRLFRKPLNEYPLSIAIPRFTQVVETIGNGQQSPAPLWHILHDLSNRNPTHDSMWCEVLEIVAELIGNFIRSYEAPSTELSSLPSAICALLHATVPASSAQKFCDIFRRVCDRAEGMSSMLVVIGASSSAGIEGTVVDRMRVIFSATLDYGTRQEFLRGATRALRGYASGSHEKWGTMESPVNVVRICQVLLQIHNHSHSIISPSPRPYNDKLPPSWKQLWDATVLALAAFAATSDNCGVYESDALECLALLDAWYDFDARIMATLSPSESSGRTESIEPFPDAMFAVLPLYITKRDTLRQYGNLQSQFMRSDMLYAVRDSRLRDEFQGETLWEYLPKVGFKLNVLFPHLLTELRELVPSQRFNSENTRDFPDLTALTQRAWRLTVDIATSVIVRDLPDNLDEGDSVKSTQDVQDALFLLLARFQYDMPAQGPGPKNLAHVLHRIRPSLAHLPDIRSASIAVNRIAMCAFYKFSEGDVCRHSTLQQCFWDHRDLDCDDFWLAIRNVYMDRAGNLVQLVNTNKISGDNWAAFNSANCCRIPRSAMHDFQETLRQLLLHPRNLASNIYWPMVVLEESNRMPSYSALAEGIRSVYAAADEPTRRQFIRVFTSIPRDYNENKTKSKWLYNYIRTLLLHLEIYKVHCPLDASDRLYLPASQLQKGWDDLWTATVTSLQKFAREKEPDRAEQRELALESFALLDGFEGRIRQAATVATVTSDQHPHPNEGGRDGAVGSPFPDKLYVALAAFVPIDEAAKLVHFEHIQQRLPASHRQPNPPKVTEVPEEDASVIKASST